MHYSFALGLLISLAALVLILWGGQRKNVSPTVTLALAVSLLLWTIVPLLLQTTFVDADVTSSSAWSRETLAIVQPALVLVLVIVHLAYKRPYIPPLKGFLDGLAPDAHLLGPAATIALLLLIIVEFRIISLTGTSFLEVNAFAVSASASEQSAAGILETVLSLLLGLFLSIISIGSAGKIRRSTLLIAWCGVFIFSGFAVARGMRAFVLLPVITALIGITTLDGRMRRRATVWVVAGAALTILVGGPFAAIAGILRQRTGGVSLEAIQSVVTATSESMSIEEQVQLLAAEVNRKFDEIGPGVELLALEPPESAGLTPVVSAAQSFIPRALYPNKPVPTSRDGTSFGVPYRIAAKAYGDVEVGMVMPVSPAAIAIWELGTIGLLWLVLFNLMNLVLLNTLFVTRNVLSRAIGFSVIGIPTFQAFVAPPSLIVQNTLRLGLLVAMLIMATLCVRALVTSVRNRRIGALPA